MKKLMRTIALTVAAVLVLGMTAFAADSTSTTSTDNLANKLGKDAIEMNYTVKGADKVNPVGPDWLARAQAYASAHGLGQVLTVFDLTSANKNVTASVDYDGLEAGKSYVFIHYTGADWENTYDAEAWEVVAASVNGKTITGTFASLSPVAIVEGTAGSAAVVAPKTGEVIAITAILALIMMAGAAVCAKKARLQK